MRVRWGGEVHGCAWRKGRGTLLRWLQVVPGARVGNLPPPCALAGTTMRLLGSDARCVFFSCPCAHAWLRLVVTRGALVPSDWTDAAVAPEDTAQWDDDWDDDDVEDDFCKHLRAELAKTAAPKA
jgi:hypothetical protein